MRENTKEAHLRKGRRGAWQSAVISSAILLLNGVLMLALRSYYAVEGLGGAILLILSVLELGMIIPVWILLRARLKEIEGGEEYEASQY